MRAAIYGRVGSSDRQLELEGQVERARAYARAQRWRVVGVFTDIASSSDRERDGLRRLMRASGSQRFDVLVVDRVDRLARGIPDLTYLLSTLDDSGTNLVSVSENFDVKRARRETEPLRVLQEVAAVRRSEMYGPGVAAYRARRQRPRPRPPGDLGNG